MTVPAVLRRWTGPAPTPFVGGVAVERAVRLRRVAPWGAVVLTVLAAHVAVMPHLAPGGIAPDGLLVAVVAVAAGRGARAGAAFGFAAGLGADVFLSTPLGTSALAYTVLGHALGRSSRARPAGAGAALCTPTSTCFACRTGRRPVAEAAAPETPARPTRLRRRGAPRRAALRRSAILTLGGVCAGQIAVQVVATGLGGVPFPDLRGVLGMAGVAAVSVPFGPPTFAAVGRLDRSSRSRP